MDKKFKRPKGYLTLEEIGKILGITSERARQILENAEKKMRKEARRLHMKEDDFTK